MKTKEAYAAYLKTPHWENLRVSALKRDGYKCKRCGATNVELNVHHKIYRNEWTDTLLVDLETLCRCCHEKEHHLQSIPVVPAIGSNGCIYATVGEVQRARSDGKLSRREFEFFMQKLGARVQHKKMVYRRPKAKKKKKRKHVSFKNSIRLFSHHYPHWQSRGTSSN